MQRAFSLIELVIVVVIIAVIAAIAMPRATEASRNAEAAAMAAHIRRVADAFELHHAEHGQWPPDSSPGATPTVMVDRLRPGDIGPTPVGGSYDWQNRVDAAVPLGGIWFGVCGHQAGPRASELLQRVDAILDDGDLETGMFVEHSLYEIDVGGGYASLRLDHPGP